MCFHNHFIHHIGKALDIPVRILVAPPIRARRSLINGDVDFVMTINKTLMLDYADVVSEINQTRFVVIADPTLRTRADLRGEALALIRGGEYLQGLRNDPSVEKVFTSSHFQSMDMLLKGRVASAVVPEQILRLLEHAGRLNTKDFSYPLPPWSVPVYLYCRKGVCNPQLQADIREAINQLSDSVRNQWFKEAIAFSRNHELVTDPSPK